MGRKSYWLKQKEKRIAWSRNANAAKERKRLAEADGLVEAGGCVTWGCMVHHDIRLLAYPDGRHVAVVVDGVHKRPRTLRGVWRCLARMIGRGAK